MPDEDIENVDSTNDATEEVVNTEEVEETDVQPETEDASSLEEKNKRLFERAKKAEAEAKALKAQLKPKPKEPTPAPSETGSLSIRDLAAIKDLEVDDAEWLANYSQKMGISLSDARKDKDVKTILAARVEERKTAEATATGTARRSSGKVSVETLLERAEKGEIPDDDESLQKMFDAHLRKRKPEPR